MSPEQHAFKEEYKEQYESPMESYQSFSPNT